jgi:hypothetical protein
MKLVFLHLPKTAGQSVHNWLVAIVGREGVAPCRVNTQLWPMSVAELRSFSLVSGHLDWSLLDCVEAPKFVFTVLRKPVDRILSFYFFLRSEAQKLSPEELAKPENQGKHAVLHLSPDEYFNGGPAHIRTFLDNHYDNFYMYYFAGRTYDARQRLKATPPGHVVRMAFDNLETLSGVYTIGQLDRLESDIQSRFPQAEGRLPHVNRGDTDDATRVDALKSLGATSATFERLQAMTEHDDRIWRRFHGAE